MSTLKRRLLILAGSLSLVTGIIGIVLPVLPTTPFLLLAAWCYARGSQRFYDGLTGHPLLGPYIRNWTEHHSIPLRVKLTAIAMVIVTMSSSIWFFVSNRWVQLGMALTGIAVITYLLRLPTRQVDPPPSA